MKTTMKINIIRIVLFILILTTFITIFRFSSQDGQTSSSLSKEVTEKVTKRINKIQNLEETERKNVLSRIEKIIRKIAHFSLYTIVGILLMSLACTYEFTEFKRGGISFLIGLMYACLDELHQFFISERSAQITDVMIDSMGVLFGILLVMLIYKIYTSRKEK
jgi:VanZ family protein